MITSTLRKMRPQRPHLVYLVVLLLCSFGLTGVIAYQAWDASRGEHEASRTAVLGYTSRYAEDFTRIAPGMLLPALIDAFLAIGQSVGGEPLTYAELLENFEVGSLCRCIDRTSILGTHRYDFANGILKSSAGLPSDGVSEFLHHELPAAEVFPSKRWGLAVMADGGDRPRSILFLTDHPENQPPRYAYGIEVAPAAFGLLMDRLWKFSNGIAEDDEEGMAGAAAMAHGEPPLLSARVLLADGTPAYQTVEQYGSEYSARASLQPPLTGMSIEVALDPDRLDAVLLDGFPETRLPVLVAVLGITFALLVVAILMIRREADITRLRSDFIAGVSHELRTPLAQIRMFAETLMLGRVRSEPERQRSLEIIDQEARRLAHLVENVLLFARSERRRSRVSTELTDLNAHLRETIHGFAVLCRTRDIELRPELQDGVVAPVDQGALRQILLNLLDNAVKYGPLRQRITIGLALFEDHARIWVDDEGPGIPETERATVFQSFFRLGRDIDSAIAGSGIGLSIVRELATLHGGRAWVDEAPGGGARVVVELPGAYVRPDVGVGGWAVA